MGNITSRETIGVSQVTNSGTTSNDADESIDLALTDSFTCAVTSSNTFTVTDVTTTFNFTRNSLFLLSPSGVTAATTILVPAVKKGMFAVKNTLGFDATVGISGQSEAVDTVEDGTTSMFSSDGINVRIAGSAGGGTLESLTDVDSLTAATVGHVLYKSGSTQAGWKAESGGAGDALPFVLSPTWRGAIATMVGDDTVSTASSGYTIPWDDELEDTDVIHDNSTNNTRLTVPAGVTRVRLVGQLRVATLAANNCITALIQKGGSSFLGMAQTRQEIGNNDIELNITTTVVAVASGDYFELRIATESDDDVIVRQDRSLFAMEIVETTNTVPSLRTVVASLPAKWRGAHLTKSSNQAITTATVELVTFDAAETDTDSAFNNTNDSVVIPAGVRRANIYAGIAWGAGTAGDQQVFVRINDAAFEGQPASNSEAPPTNTGNTNVSASGILVTAGDEITLHVRHTNGSNKDVNGTDPTFLIVEYVEFNSSTDAVQAYIAIPPEHKGSTVSTDQSDSLTNATDNPIDWTTADIDTKFDPGDGGGQQRFWLGVDWTFVDGDVSTGNDTITETAHGYETGEGPIEFTTSGTLPAGLATATKYWVIRDTADTIQLATSRANALAGTQIDITGAAGGGTHTVDQESYLVIPAGVSKARFDAYASIDGSTLQANSRLLVDGTEYGIGAPRQDRDETTGDDFWQYTTAVLPVVEGERYQFSIVPTGGTVTLEASPINTYFSIEVVEESRAITYPGVTVTPPWRGTLVSPASDTSDFSGGLTKLPMLTSHEDTDSIFDNTNDRLVVPSGVTRVEVSLNIIIQTISTDDLRYEIWKNGSASYTGQAGAIVRHDGNGTTHKGSISTDVIPVVTDDYFEVFLFFAGDTTTTVNAGTYFEMTVVEADENAFPPHQIEIFLDKAAYDTDAFPTTAGDPIYKMVAPRRFTLADDFAGSVAHSEVAASGGAVAF